MLLSPLTTVSRFSGDVRPAGRPLGPGLGLLVVPSEGESGRCRDTIPAIGAMAAWDELRLLGCSCETEPVKKEAGLAAECGDLE